MTDIIFDQVVRIDGAGLEGIYRVLAVSPQQQAVFLAKLPDEKSALPKGAVPVVQAPLEALLSLEADGLLRAVKILPAAHRCLRPDELSTAARKRYELRKTVLLSVFDSERLSKVFETKRPKAHLVRDIQRTTGFSRAEGHRLLNQLFQHGFNAGSLYPSFNLSGARGVPRSADGRGRSGRKTNAQRLGAASAFQQTGLTTKDRARIMAVYRRLPDPKPSMSRIYQEVLLRLYATEFKETDRGLVPVVPAIGTYPNPQQVERLIRSERDPLQLARDRTTLGHFLRNHRPLKGAAHDGVPGPGHCYAIDSTIADIGLRSAINRAWPLGRPIAYLLVDVWSGATVGFYVCLQGPSWRTAKLSLFSACADEALMGEIWGYVPLPGLDPPPTLPAELRCDRGEYLSRGALETMQELGVHLTYNPAYRPDLKGSVEVFHRITKDHQFRFIPGAIDRRRQELELRPESKAGVFTLREYVQYLYYFFHYLNQHREIHRRLGSEMIADGVDPTPASLWNWGHRAGFGYRRAHPFEIIAPKLLNPEIARVTPKGVFLGRLHYEADFVESQRWTGLARARGGWEIELLQYLGSLQRTWWVDRNDGGVRPLMLSPHALAAANVSLDEWSDAEVYNSLNRGRRLHQKAQGGVELLSALKAQVESATRLTREAEELHGGDELPSVHMTRAIEGAFDGLPASRSSLTQMSRQLESARDEEYEDGYLDLMRKVLHGDS